MESLTVLTIDDNDSIRLSLASFLEDLGYNVLDADCGEAGIEIIKEQSIDIILTDTHMPGLSGIDVLRFAKENKPDTPVIIISGAGEIKFAVEALRAGAWDYITKPIEDLNFLSYTIEKVLKRVSLIKENRQKSRELKETNVRLKDTIEELKTTQSQLVESEKMASLGYMVKGVAHEINTPLGVCMTSISYVNEQAKSISVLNDSHNMKLSDFVEFTKNTMDLTGIIYESLQTINNLIIDFKQLSVENLDDNKKSFILNDIISSAILLISSSYPNMEIDINIVEDIYEVNSFPEVFSLIFMKLTENAIIHGFNRRQSGRLNVDIYKEDNYLFISFKNNGETIDDEIINKIFDPFFTQNKKTGQV
ncbi:hybrid sensor histidine kinase/response regulator [Thiospirochaeta perfilievii]|uniref:hybrid sensor histidine kinase/response regulator n=1 Tax=Thiospirochaeta perfilievii TaxID=252967 RepID=UPI00165A0523|nr:hybrid sensor histidine kinase/response regulator [Thiospirochaeta perfilievii]